MRFTKFEIRNYRGIKDLTLELSRQPKTKIFTLVGLNESGKTSILEAINLFQEDIPEADRHNLIPKGEKISFTGNIIVKATLEVSEKDNTWLADYAKKLGYKSISNYESIEITKEYSFKNSVFQTKTTRWTYLPEAVKLKARKPIKLEPGNEDWSKLANYIKSYLVPKIVYYPNFLFDFPEKIYIDSQVGNSTEESTYRNTIQDILSSIRSDLTIKEQLLDRMQQNNKASNEALDSALSQMGSIVTQLVFNAWEKLFSRGNKSIEITYDFENTTIVKKSPLGSSYDTTNEVKRYYLTFRLKEGANKFYIHERSLGFKWFFAFLLFTEFRKHRSTDYVEVLFLLDEPASNLHSTAQRKLLKTFEGLIDKSTLIYTTHSHHLINPEWLSGAHIVRNKAIKEMDDFDYNVNLTDVEAVPYRTFVANNPGQKDYFQPILDTLDYQPGLLEKVPNIITTEGKNDFYTFKYINQEYFSNKYAGLNFYPSTGADTNTPVIALYIAWSRPLIVLLDGDAKGEAAKKSYVNKFGGFINNSIYHLYDINESFRGLSLEELFTDEEKTKITQEFDAKSVVYEKSKFNSALQTLLFEKRKVELSQATIGNFKKIFEFLSKKLVK